MTFLELPFAIILEICSYLDASALIALADTNNVLRNLSRSYKSYWLPSVLLEGLLLPVAHRSLMSFSPGELGIATRRALFRERNFKQEAPVLYSSTRIDWPYPGLEADPSRGGPDLGSGLGSQLPSEVCWIPSLHANGDWCFTLSKDWTLRTIYLRTGVLVMEELLYVYPTEDHSLSPAEYSFDSVDETHARIAVITPYDEDKTQPYQSVLTTYTIHLDPKRPTATLSIQGSAPLTMLPRHFDIAGDYAVIVEDTETDDSEWPGYGVLHLVDWRTGACKKLPPLLHSFGIAAFPDYFITLGVSPEQRIELQVVSLLPPQHPQHVNGHTTQNHVDDEPEESSFPLAASIPLRSDTSDILLQSSDELAQICHTYTGRTHNTIRAWIRDDFGEGCFSVFTVHADFSRSPEQWFTLVEDFDAGGILRYEVEHKRLTEKPEVGRYIVPGSCGTRFFWWKEHITPINPGGVVDADGDTIVDDSQVAHESQGAGESQGVGDSQGLASVEEEEVVDADGDIAVSDSQAITDAGDDSQVTVNADIASATGGMSASASLNRISCKVELFSSTLNSLPRLVPQVIKSQSQSQRGEEVDMEREREERYEMCVSYPERTMDCPFQCEMNDEVWEDDDEDLTAVYSVIAEDWSGTVLVILTSGDLLVLRYGHP